MPVLPVSKPKGKTFTQKFPIIEMIGNIPIRKVNYVSFYFDERAMRKIARLIQKAPSLSVAKLVALSSKPCDNCKDKKIMLAVGTKVVLIPRGLLSCKRETNGSNISKKKRSGK